MVRRRLYGCRILATVVGKLWEKSERIRPAAVSWLRESRSVIIWSEKFSK